MYDNSAVKSFKFNSFILRLFVCSLLIRLAALSFLLLVGHSYSFHPDAILYHALASAGPSEFLSAGAAGIFSKNGYPALLSILYWIFGQHPVGGQIMNVVVGSFIPCFGYSIARSISENLRAAKLVGVVLAIAPYSVYLSTQLLKDSLTILLELSIISGFITIRRQRSLLTSCILAFNTIVLYSVRSDAVFLLAVAFLASMRRRVVLIMVLPIIGITAAWFISYLSFFAISIDGADILEIVNSVRVSAFADTHIEFFSNHTYPTNFDSYSSLLIYIVAIPAIFSLTPNMLQATSLLEVIFSVQTAIYSIYFMSLVYYMLRQRGGLSTYWSRPEFRLVLTFLIFGVYSLYMIFTSNGALVRWREQFLVELLIITSCFIPKKRLNRF